LPFLIVDWELSNPGPEQQLSVCSNLGEHALVNTSNRLYSEEGQRAPRADIRVGLAGRMTRAAYYRLAEILEERAGQYGLFSGGSFNVVSTSP
ncbi:MAG: hypothetical protein ACPGSC_12800, partial [Granulosicoccaceae bacterium]